MHFQDLPFYETGKVRKNPIGPEDIEITKNLIQEIKPHQIYAAGDLSDPHGTHRVCLDAIFAALRELKDEEWMKDCWTWLYRGAWQEWDIEDIEMAVPLSPKKPTESEELSSSINRRKIVRCSRAPISANSGNVPTTEPEIRLEFTMI